MVKWGWGWTLYSVITFSIFINLADQNIMVRLFPVTVLFTSPTIRSVFLAQLNNKSKNITRYQSYRFFDLQFDRAGKIEQVVGDVN